jgi:hypothetical protein
MVIGDKMANISVYGLVAIPFFIIGTMAAWAEPYSPSCEIAIGNLSKARDAVVPFQRTMELARAREQKAYGELSVCTGGGLFSLDKAVHCEEVTWQAPVRTKEAIEAEEQYRQGRQEFEQLFEQAKRACLFDP